MFIYTPINFNRHRHRRLLLAPTTKISIIKHKKFTPDDVYTPICSPHIIFFFHRVSFISQEREKSQEEGERETSSHARERERVTVAVAKGERESPLPSPLRERESNHNRRERERPSLRDRRRHHTQERERVTIAVAKGERESHRRLRPWERERIFVRHTREIRRRHRKRREGESHRCLCPWERERIVVRHKREIAVAAVARCRTRQRVLESVEDHRQRRLRDPWQGYSTAVVPRSRLWTQWTQGL